MAIISSGQLTLTDLNDAKQIYLNLDANYGQQVFDPNTGVYNPNFTAGATNLIIKPQVFIAGGDGSNLLPNGGTPVANAQVVSVTWYAGSADTGTIIADHTVASNTAVNTTDYTVAGGSPASVDKKLTVKTNFTSKDSQKFTCKVVYKDPDTGFNVTLYADKDILKITNGVKGDVGVNSITAFASNSAVTLPSDSAGTVSTYNYSGTDIYVYDGATALVYDGVGTTNGKFKITATPTSITVGAITASSSGTARAIVANASGASADTANISYAIVGKSLVGDAINVTVTQTFNKSKNGSSPTLYRLIPSANAIQQNVSNVYNPTSITASATSAVGNATPTAYGARFIIAESTDGTTFVDKYSSANTEATSGKVYTPSATNVKSIRIRMYVAGTGTPVHGTTQMFDEQAIPVVKDGATGIDSIYLNLYPANGDTISNGVGSLDIQALLYKGATTVTATSYTWYIQDPTATTSSGGDTAGGNGWRKLTGLGVADPTTSPTLTQVANANSRLVAQTYYVKYTWIGLSGETIGNTTEATLAVTAGNDLKITIPAFATNAVGARVYVGLATGNTNLKYQGTITTSAGFLQISTHNANGELIPTVSTCSTSALSGGTLTVRPNGIAGVEGFKCVANYSSVNYSAVQVLKDATDPVMVNILGANMFKNGEGSVKLVAQLMQNGAEISTAGYTFDWVLYNVDNTFNKNLALNSGDTITVQATDVNGMGNVIVDVKK